MLPLILSEKYNNPVDKKLRLYVTEDSLSEFIQDVGFGAQTSLDLRWTYHGFMRDEADLSEMKTSLVDKVEESTSVMSHKRVDILDCLGHAGRYAACDAPFECYAGGSAICWRR